MRHIGWKFDVGLRVSEMQVLRFRETRHLAIDTTDDGKATEHGTIFTAISVLIREYSAMQNPNSYTITTFKYQVTITRLRNPPSKSSPPTTHQRVAISDLQIYPRAGRAIIPVTLLPAEQQKPQYRSAWSSRSARRPQRCLTQRRPR
jgi:hypothetical protein